MELTFELTDVPAERLLSVKTVSDEQHFASDIDHVIGSIYKAVNGWASGPPVCIYPEGYDPEQIVAIAGVPYRGDPMYGYETTELPATRALVGHFSGDYEGIGDAWRQTLAHLEEEGLAMNGMPYERYLTRTSADIVVPVG